LTTNGVDANPAFGRHDQIAFSRFSDSSGSYDIFLRNARGGVRRLTADPANEEDPAFTPDGRRIIFYKDHSTAVALSRTLPSHHPGALEADGLYSIRSNGTGLEAVSEIERPWSFDVSPDGRQLAFGRIEQVPEISTMSLITGKARSIPGEAMFPSYSPGGNRIAFSNYSGLWVLNASGGGAAERILPAEFSRAGVGDLLVDFAWQPLPRPPRRGKS
jgi:Tol biopolymer transport system component